MCKSDYFDERAEQEREAATRAAHPKAREVHLSLADLHARKARDVRAQSRRSGFHVVPGSSRELGAGLPHKTHDEPEVRTEAAPDAGGETDAQALKASGPNGQ